jgi:heme o synthase
MTEEPQEAPKLSSPAGARLRPEIADTLRDYVSLTKPEINALVLISTVAGAWMAFASRHVPFAPAVAANAVFGTALVASGAGALNQALEKRFDALMSRTMRRPVASGRVPAVNAACLGSILGLAGFFWLLATVNVRAALLALFALAVYIMVYTPLKRLSSLSLIVGAIAGAVPPLIGWFAAGGVLNSEAALIFSLLFLWQFPHFMSIAWLCRGDYDRAGYRIVPDDPFRHSFVAVMTLLPAFALVTFTLCFAFSRGALLYALLVALIGIAFLALSTHFVIVKNNSSARRLLAASIYYLPVAFALLILAEAYRFPLH